MNEERPKYRTAVIVLSIVLSVILLFAAYNVFWFVKVYQPYDAYADEMQVFTARQSYHFEEGDFVYNVKRPGYLSYTGNLGISYMDDSVALLIWPGKEETETYGIMLPDDHCYIDKEGKAIHPEQAALISANQEKIQTLLQKAEERWHIISADERQ